MKLFIISAWLILLGHFSNAQYSNSIEIQVDEDFFVASNEDRNYTGGLKIDFSSSLFETSVPHKTLSFLNTFVHKKLFKNTSLLELPNAVGFNATLFTPDSLGTVIIIDKDRPYSSLISLEIRTSFLTKKENLHAVYRKTNIQRNNFNFRYSNVSLGLLGLNLMGNVQGGLHSINNPDYKDTLIYSNPVQPYGWDNQISNGGGLTGLIQFGASHLITSKYLSKWIMGNSNYDRFSKGTTNKNGYSNGSLDKTSWLLQHFEWKMGYEVMLGYYNNFQLNTDVRFGIIDPTRWYKLGSKTSAISNKKRKGLELRPRHSDNWMENIERKGFELYLFGGIKGNAMVYNSLLRGQLFDFLTLGNSSVHTLSASEVNPLFVSGYYGIALRMKNVLLSYVPLSFRTSEIDTDSRFVRRHEWAEIKLTINW